jgi:hypothetical protein
VRLSSIFAWDRTFFAPKAQLHLEHGAAPHDKAVKKATSAESAIQIPIWILKLMRAFSGRRCENLRNLGRCPRLELNCAVGADRQP